MGLNAQPSGERVHIGFFGLRNAGKSSVVNRVTGQTLSIVSDVKGTTTDPVQKAMELLPIGPVVIVDTPGIDDEGTLGEERVRRALRVLEKTDIAVLVTDSTRGLQPAEQELIELFRKREVKISHNPASAMRVLGFARIPKMLEMGLRPSIGTDGASSSNHMDMVDEMWLTSLIHKGWRLDPTVVPSQDILRMATKWGRGHCLTRNSTAVSRPGRRRISSSSTRTARR